MAAFRRGLAELLAIASERRAKMPSMRACPGHCAMHHECPCADKAERHPSGGVADTPGTGRSAKAVPGRQLRGALEAIRQR